MLEIVEFNPTQPAELSVIWLHGLGASGDDFALLAPELNQLIGRPVRFVFPHAPEQPVTINGGMVMRAWFDIRELSSEGVFDLDGVEQSCQAVAELIKAEMVRGFSLDQIVLAGFSQGGAIALYAGLCADQPLAGILALSTFLPVLDEQLILGKVQQRKVPIFMAHGEKDEVLPLAWGRGVFDLLSRYDFPITWHPYPMAHSVCPQEVADIAAWLKAKISS